MEQEQREYFENMYTSIGILSEKSRFVTAEIEEFINSGCIPKPSYELRLREEAYAYINSEINTLAIETTERYFSKDIVHLLEFLDRMKLDYAQGELAKRMKAEQMRQFCDGLDLYRANEFNYLNLYQTNGEIDGKKLEAHFEDYIWPNWLNGTWGICVYDSHIGQNIARKTIAVERVRMLTENGKKSAFTDLEAIEVKNACDEYNEIVPPFSPHDRHDSSRANLVDTALENIKLNQARG